MRLAFEENSLWEQLAPEAKNQLVHLLSQILKAVLQAEGRLSLTGEAERLRDPFEFLNLLDPLCKKTWSNDRLVRLADGKVTFTYKDYSQNGRRREMTLPIEEFIRRFLLHILPHRFVRIRYYGFYANRHRQQQLERCRVLLAAAPAAPKSDEREDWE